MFKKSFFQYWVSLDLLESIIQTLYPLFSSKLNTKQPLSSFLILIPLSCLILILLFGLMQAGLAVSQENFDNCLVFLMHSDHPEDIAYLCVDPLTRSSDPFLQMGAQVDAKLYALNNGRILVETIPLFVNLIDETYILGRWVYFSGEGVNFSVDLTMGPGYLPILKARVTHLDGHHQSSNRYGSEPRPNYNPNPCRPSHCR